MSRLGTASRRLAGSESVRFLIAGAINTVTSYVIYLALLHAIGYLPAYSAGYAAGVVVSYFLNTRFVFRTAPRLSSFVRFPLVYVAQYLLGGLLLWLGVDVLGIPRELALAFSIAVTVPFTFFASRFVLKAPRT